MSRLALLLAAVVAALASAASAAEPAALRLTELASARFPDRGYALSLPAERTLAPRDVQVTENGERVSGLTVVPATALGSNEYALVLAIDASLSMKGKPIEGAMVAARAFAARRNPAQRLGALVFNARTRLLLPLTTDATHIDQALATAPKLAYYTRTNDTVIETIDLLRREKIGSASVVLLSDGKDVGSRATLDEAVARANQASVRVFSVGLRSRSFDQTALRALAERTGGFYIEAGSPAQLARIFSGLGSQLANEYFIHYRSLAGPDEQVQVKVKVRGFDDVLASGYRTPALPQLSAEPFKRPASERILLSTWLMVLVGFVAAALAAAALVLLLLPRRSTLRRRIGAFVSLAQPARREEQRQRRDVRRRLAAPGADQPAPTSRWARLEEALELARIDISATSLVLWTVLGTFSTAWLLLAVSGVGAAALLALAIPIGVRALVKLRLGRVRRKFADQLPDNLEVLASGLRAGHSLVGALSLVVADAPEPSKSELSRVIGDEQLGVPLDEALVVVVRRMESRDLDQVALVARLQRETGANSTEVLDRVVESIRDRQAVRRLVQTLTAQGRLSGGVLVALPILMLVLLVLLNADYVKPLFTEPLGRGMLIAAVVMIGLGWAAIRRIIDIKV